jgi:hypothetical protein
MGHTHLGKQPKSKYWDSVVEIFSTSGASGARPLQEDEIREVALRSMEAADAGLRSAIGDFGLKYTYFALTQLALAGKTSDQAEKFSSVGISASERTSVLDVVSAFQEHLDKEIERSARHTDVSEMAQKAAISALMTTLNEQSISLFDDGEDAVKRALKSVSTKAGFSKLGQRFFAGFMARFLNFYLSRITAAQTGSKLTPSISSVSEFNQALELHCFQSAHIVKDFCGGWYSKTEFEGGITSENASGFVAVALKKLRAELAQQKEEEHA